MRNRRRQLDERTAALQSDILRTLLYFDIFDHPLKLPEILQFLPSNSVTLKDLRSAFLSQPLNNQVTQNGEFYYVKGRPESIVDQRAEKERRAHRMMRIARIVSRIVRQLPFVRAVFVSGELAKGVAGKHSDIDFVIVTARNRVWIVRTLCTVFKKAFLFNRKKFFCYNHIVSEQRLDVADRNIYTAIEVVTLRPMVNGELFGKFLSVNSWTQGFLPNSLSSSSAELPKHESTTLLERTVDAVVPSTTLDAIDNWLLKQWRHAWIRRYPKLTPMKRSQLFQCNADVSTAYVQDFLETIIGQYELRLQEYNLTSSSAGLRGRDRMQGPQFSHR